MDCESQEAIRESIERKKIQQEAIDGYIEARSEEFLRSDTWETFDASEIAEVSLKMPIDSANCVTNDDEQTHRFRQFLAIATNFSSLRLADKLYKIPELVESLKQLLETMIKEVQEYSDMANELRDLIHCFVRMVMHAKHNVNMMLPLLEAATTQLSVVEDVMSTDPSQQLNQADRKDIKDALDRMSSGIENLLKLAKSAAAESQKLDERMQKMTDTVQSKKMVVEERIEIANFCFKYSKPAGAIGGALGAGGCIAAEAFGGVGALVIAGTAFSTSGCNHRCNHFRWHRRCYGRSFGEKVLGSPSIECAKIPGKNLRRSDRA